MNDVPSPLAAGAGLEDCLRLDAAVLRFGHIVGHAQGKWHEKDNLFDIFPAPAIDFIRHNQKSWEN